jgi:hypothetical protein
MQRKVTKKKMKAHGGIILQLLFKEGCKDKATFGAKHSKNKTQIQ